MARLKVKVGDIYMPPGGGSYGAEPWPGGGAVRNIGATSFLLADDDDSASVTFPFPWHGHSTAYVNKNGALTFQEPLGRYPYGVGQGYVPRQVWEFGEGVYPYWMDVDTTYEFPTSAARGIVVYGPTTISGANAYQVTWDQVASFPSLDPVSDFARNRFQLILYPDGWMEWNYDYLGLDCGAASWSGYDLTGHYANSVNTPLYGLADRPLKDQTIVFLLDVSGSISAGQLAKSQQLALSYLEKVPHFVEVGVVEFASTAFPILDPTTNRSAVIAAIESARTHGSGASTYLYDGVTMAVSRIAGDYPHATIVVFSDGDTAGDATMVDVLKVTKWAQCVIDYVDLYDFPHADYYMAQMVAQTGGRYVWHDRVDDLLLDRTGRTVWNLPIVGFYLYGGSYEFPGSGQKVTAFDYEQNRLVYDAFMSQGTSGFTDGGPYALAGGSNCGVPGRYRFHPGQIATSPSFWNDYGDGVPVFGGGQVWKYGGYHNPGGGTLKVKGTGGWHTADNYCHPGERTGRLKVKVAEGSGPGVWGHAAWMRRA